MRALRHRANIASIAAEALLWLDAGAGAQVRRITRAARRQPHRVSTGARHQVPIEWRECATYLVPLTCRHGALSAARTA